MRLLTRTGFILFISMIIILGAATLVERSRGSDFVAEYVYHSWWFALLWGALFCSAMGLIIGRSLHRNRPVFMLHASFGVILAGAMLTFLSAEKGYLHLREGIPAGEFSPEDGTGLRPLPFEMTLESFRTEYYKGTGAPSDYVSRVTVHDRGVNSSHVISMNNILKHRGYRFYQASFDEDGHGSTLSMNHDPWGIPVTYTGYLLLGISMLWTLLSPQGGFRRLLSDPRLKKTGITAVLLLMATGGATAAPATITREQGEAFGRLQMLYNGRIAPVQTFARDFTLKLCGKPHWGDFSAEQVLAGWIFYPEQWQHEPMVRIKSAGMRRIAGSREMAPFTSFFDGKRNYKLASGTALAKSGARNGKLHKAIAEADEKIQLIAMLQAGEYLPLLPVRTTDGLRWYSPADQVCDAERGDSLFVKGIFPLIYQALLAGDGAEVDTLICKIASFQQRQGGNELLSPRKLGAELWYNRMDLSTTLYRLNLVFGLLAFIYFCWSVATGRRKGWLQALFLVQLIHSLAFVTVNLALRGYIAGHVPLSNGYETMMFIAWCVLLVTVIFRRKFFLVTASGFILSGFALLVSALGAMNPQITPLMPVLSSSWLSIHVSLIMVSYALLGFVALNGMAALVLWLSAQPATAGKVDAQIDNLQLVSRLFLYPAVFLLAAGIFVGAVWANVSWGRYWGWDPKEVWALVTMMVYALPLHGGSLRRFNRPLFFHSYAIVALCTVLMTYFGVNYLLGGMHSYGGETSLPAAAWFALLPLMLVPAVALKRAVKRTRTLPRRPGHGSALYKFQ